MWCDHRGHAPKPPKSVLKNLNRLLANEGHNVLGSKDLRIWVGDIFVPDSNDPSEWNAPHIPGTTIPIFASLAGAGLMTTVKSAEELLNLDPGTLIPDPTPLTIHELTIMAALYQRLKKKDLPESWTRDDVFLIPIKTFADLAYRGYRETKIAIDVHYRAITGTWVNVSRDSEVLVGNTDTIVSMIGDILGFDPITVSGVITKRDLKEAKEVANKITVETETGGLEHIFPISKVAEIANRIFKTN